jgi:SAM-dependent methyltransferase
MPSSLTPAQLNYLQDRIDAFWNFDTFERVIVPLLDVPVGGRALDAGCGYGALALTLARARPDLAITGVDRDPQALGFARQLAHARGLPPGSPTFVTSDARRLDFLDARFDLVACQALLGEVADPAAVLAELARVLRPGGALLAVERHGLDLGHNTVTGSSAGAARQIEAERLARLFMAGKRALGRGDDEIGLRVPFLAESAGLELVDVRLRDRVLHAVPPYRSPGARATLALASNLSARPWDEAARRAVTENILAGGGAPADADRALALWDDPAVRDAVRQALASGAYGTVEGSLFYVTVARKPVYNQLSG